MRLPLFFSSLEQSFRVHTSHCLELNSSSLRTKVGLVGSRIRMEHHHSHHTRQIPRTKQDVKYPTSPTHLNAFASSKSRSNRKAYSPSSFQDHQPMARARAQAIRRNQSLWMMTISWIRLLAMSNRETSPCSVEEAARARVNVGACPKPRNLNLGTWSSPLRQKRRHLRPGSQWSHELNTVTPYHTNMGRAYVLDCHPRGCKFLHSRHISDKLT